MIEPTALPPPPFWRTRYFAFDVLPRRPYLDMLEILRIVRQPERRVLQRDGRIRLYGWSTSLDGWLRVVLLEDGRTVHNAFLEDGLPPPDDPAEGQCR